MTCPPPAHDAGWDHVIPCQDGARPQRLHDRPRACARRPDSTIDASSCVDNTRAAAYVAGPRWMWHRAYNGQGYCIFEIEGTKIELRIDRLLEASRFRLSGRPAWSRAQMLTEVAGRHGRWASSVVTCCVGHHADTINGHRQACRPRSTLHLRIACQL